MEMERCILGVLGVFLHHGRHQHWIRNHSHLEVLL